jgi:Uma2 family endonuclease
MITEQAISTRVWTDDELLALPEEKLWKLVDGELIEMSPAGAEHGIITARLLAAVLHHAETHKLGVTVNSSTGFRLNKTNCFAADIAFVRKQRVAKLMPNKLKFFQGPPDFAIEIKSPSNSLGGIEREINVFLEHGTELAWLVLPQIREVRVFGRAGERRSFGIGDVVSGEPVMPKFQIAVTQIFADPVFD